MLRRSALWLLLCVLQGFVATASQAATPEEIEAARKKGVQYLLDSQKPDGHWEYANHEIGITSLCAIALIENGVPVDDPKIELAQRYVLDNYLEEKGTYDIALAILLLSRVGDRDNKAAIRDLAARLIAGQNTHGGWGYSCPKVRAGSTEKEARPAGPGDNSCTQFACLGLWVASRSGVNIDDTMAQVAYRFVMDQNADGGWPYKTEAGQPQASRNTMTFAGLFCLTVARANRIRAVQTAEANGRQPPRLPAPLTRPKVEPSTAPAADPNNPAAADAPAPAAATTVTPAAEVPFVDPGAEAATLQADPIFNKGFDMAVKYAAGLGRGSSRYFLWSVERMGVILGLEKYGTTDWFEKGADALLASQGQPAGETPGIDGAWVIASTGSAFSETSFAILFLRKANLGSDITRLLQGEPADPFQIISQESKPRFLKLEQAIAAAKPGDVIHIDTNRAVDVPHLLIDRDLTITAGYGYTPVLRYDVGFDASGRRSDPKTDPSARYMFGVKSGTLTLEGLQLQFDPPKSAGTVAWSGVSVEGGTLRMLNCFVGEANRQGYAAVSLSAPGQVHIRNSLLVGGRAAIEVTTAGQQLIEVDNSVLFSNAGISVVPGATDGAELKLDLERSAVQATNIFNFAKVMTSIEVTSRGVAYQGEAMDLNYLTGKSGNSGRRWTGKHNLYDLKKWIGFQGTPNAAIKDAKTWATFWGGLDESGSSQVITFAGKRRQGAFTLDLLGDDFEFASTSQVYANRRRTGINPVYVGPGYNFGLFREGFDYNAWREESEQLASAQ